MVATVICALCRPMLGMDPPHCFGSQGRRIKGVLGGWECGCDCKKVRAASDGEADK
jgi:hypothetical protein